MKNLFFAGLLILSGQIAGATGPGAIYLDSSRPIEERVEDALARMTTEEKVAICHAQS